MRHVVITGIGAVSPNGVGRESYKTDLPRGGIGIRSIGSFDASQMDCQIAGEVHRNENSFSIKEERNLLRTAQLLISAAPGGFKNCGMHDSLRFGSKVQAVALENDALSIQFEEKRRCVR